ncbi:cobalt-precorrin-5B (C(1))-methyltransferase CbiD [Altericista sp. CCNU0014]|uniref:cobalt-precorrin-5B (C(1))-methyltransferase CbiD n=1 Tax=Altericista sp. CCNU0014 TaxID=3082949 RepID=UPI00384F0626
MSDLVPRTGYTLPVFACGAAIAALHWLYKRIALDTVTLDLVDPAQLARVEIENACGLKPGVSLAIARSDPGDNLDLTRHTPIWAMVEWAPPTQTQSVSIVGGEGIGRQENGSGPSAIYAYARQLIETNLNQQLREGDRIQVTLLLPEGRALAKRTSNEAFGVVEGLSLLGTSGLSHPLSAPQQLEIFRAQLQDKAARRDLLVFCIGENGLDLSRRLGIPETCLVKTANWLGPLLVEAGIQGIKSILLLGYHGKLIKLAGGIFHTHHHVADGRQEILTAHGVAAGLSVPELQTLLQRASAEDGLAYLRQLERQMAQPWVARVYQSIATAIETRSQRYIYTHSERQVQIGCALFDRDRQIFAVSETGQKLLDRASTSSHG